MLGLHVEPVAAGTPRLSKALGSRTALFYPVAYCINKTREMGRCHRRCLASESVKGCARVGLPAQRRDGQQFISMPDLLHTI